MAFAPNHSADSLPFEFKKIRWLLVPDLQHGRTRNPYRQELMLIEGYMTNGLSGQSDFSMTSAMSKYQSDNADMVGVFEDQRDALWHRRNAQSLVTPTLSPLMQ